MVLMMGYDFHWQLAYLQHPKLNLQSIDDTVGDFAFHYN